MDTRYFSRLSYIISKGTRVDLKKKEALEDFFSSKENKDVYGFRNVNIITDGDIVTDIFLESYYGEFYDDDLFIDALKDILIEGKIQLVFSGREDKWGYDVTPGRADGLVYTVMLSENSYQKIKDLI